MMPTPDDAVRFERHVDRSGDCHVWTASISSKGYGKFGMGGRGAGWKYAHRIAWMLENGPIPAGMYVCHTCDNRICVNPSHLFLGSLADNNQDMVDKGRHGHGKKLTAEQVVEIRHLLSMGVTQVRIGRDFGVSASAIHEIHRGRSWAHPGQRRPRVVGAVG